MSRYAFFSLSPAASLLVFSTSISIPLSLSLMLGSVRGVNESSVNESICEEGTRIASTSRPEEASDEGLRERCRERSLSGERRSERSLERPRLTARLRRFLHALNGGARSTEAR